MKKMYVSLFVVCAAIAFTYCSSTKNATASKTESKPVPKKTNYQDNVAAIIQANCAPCHFPDKGGNKKALDSYAGVSSQVDEILRRVQLQPNERGFMPRQHPKLSDTAINVIKAWKAEGLGEK
jgi:cytochrome c553